MLGMYSSHEYSESGRMVIFMLAVVLYIDGDSSIGGVGGGGRCSSIKFE